LYLDGHIRVKIMKNTQKKPFIVDKEYEVKLKKVNDKLAAKRIDLALPKLTQEQDSVLANNLSFGCYRIAKFLFSNQGERTDIINRQCAVANVSDTVKGTDRSQTAALDRIGLAIDCELIRAKNRYGSKSVIGTLWLTVTDQKKWQEAEQRISEAA
jgi:hypothetical protein